MHMPFTGERYVPEVRGQIYYEHVHRYALAFELARDLDVLDIASGEGYGAAYLAIAARSVVGVDIDAESIRHAASRYTAMNLSFLAGSCTRIPLPDASIDLVVSFETLEHIEEHEQFMREVVRVLRPHGRLVISSPNKLVYSDEGHYHNPFHARELYFDQFRDL
ncbi:MAG TPA: class I SAM-dependent methyltransferase, partial [Candidatus Elarobacter sp.]